MTVWDEPWVRANHDGLDHPPDVADVPAWVLLPLALLLLPLLALWVLSEEAGKAVRRRCH